MPNNEERQQQILDAAAAVIIRLGYDKTTMSDIAEEAGASRRTVYLYFKGKEGLFEALLYREYMQYAQTWLEQIEADPDGGTIGGVYRAIFHAVNSRPLIAALMRRDRRVMGNYLRKRDNIFAQMVSGVNTTAQGACSREATISTRYRVVSCPSGGMARLVCPRHAKGAATPIPPRSLLSTKSLFSCIYRAWPLGMPRAAPNQLFVTAQSRACKRVHACHNQKAASG